MTKFSSHLETFSMSNLKPIWRLCKFKTSLWWNNVSFLFLTLHLFKSVALLCIYIIVITILLITCGISILLCMYFYMTHVTFQCLISNQYGDFASSKQVFGG
jgi:hypothetical protein